MCETSGKQVKVVSQTGWVGVWSPHHLPIIPHVRTMPVSVIDLPSVERGRHFGCGPRPPGHPLPLPELKGREQRGKGRRNMCIGRGTPQTPPAAPSSQHSKVKEQQGGKINGTFHNVCPHSYPAEDRHQYCYQKGKGPF